LGLFRSVSSSSSSSSSSTMSKHATTTVSPIRTAVTDHVSSIQPRFLPCSMSLLNFGRPVEVTPCNNKKRKRPLEKDVLCLGTWEIPLRGGWLALAAPTTATSIMSSSKHNKDNPPKYYGKLWFAIGKIKCYHDQQPHLWHRKLQDYNDVESPSSAYHYQLTSRIIEYRPWLAGPAPVSPVRRWMYLSTQSVFHAYITWRFHNEWEASIHHHLKIANKQPR
jgi:hypothetical protein